MCKYTIDPVYVDSSNLLTFGAIDETYARKTDIEDINTEHTHVMADITDLTFPETDLSNIASKEHTHIVSDVTNLQTTLDSKSDSGHTHEISDISYISSNWTETTLPNSRQWFSVCYSNGKFVAIAYNSAVAAYSEDGINWTETDLPSSAYWGYVCYGDEKFVAMATSSEIGAYSENGIEWTQHDLKIQLNCDMFVMRTGRLLL